MIIKKLFLLFTLVLLVTRCSTFSGKKRIPTSKEIWIQNTLNSLTLEEKIGQMIAIRCYGNYYNFDDESFKKRYILPIKKYHIGGFIIHDRTPAESIRLLNHLQKESDIPLLISADFESGTGTRVDGGTEFPPFMAFGAANSEELTCQAAQIVAKEIRAIGVHQNYSPVLDVNSNPDNPIINTRSFGSDPSLVARLGTAFIKGLQENGVIATGKHFPGHGDTDIDSHTNLPAINKSVDELVKNELFPFQAAIDTGVMSIMSAHIAVESLDSSRLPATLSRSILTGLLKETMHFDGLTVTDALEMGGITENYSVTEAAVKAVLAGADMLLLPNDVELTRDALLFAIKKGILSEKDIDERVTRILRAKAWLGLHKNKFVSQDALSSTFGLAGSEQIANTIARKSITLLKNDNSLLPLLPSPEKKIVFIALTSDEYNRQGNYFYRKLRRDFPNSSLRIVDTRTNEEEFSGLLSTVKDADAVLVGAYSALRVHKGTVYFDSEQAEYMNRLLKTGNNISIISFNSPYLIRQFPDVPGYLCAYSTRAVSQNAAYNAITGRAPVTGKLPITIPELFEFNSGITLGKSYFDNFSDLVLEDSDPYAAGLKPSVKDSLDTALAEAVHEQVAPGGVLLAAKKGKVFYNSPFGRYTYSEGSGPVAPDAIFDLASVTKVIVTTTLSMILYDQGKLNLNAYVHDFYPEFKSLQKRKITLKHLLTHCSGLPAWKPMFRELKGKDEFIDYIIKTKLEFKPGKKMVYSDLGIILLGSILEKIAGKDLETLAQEYIFDPLGMTTTMYNPGKELYSRIAPTEKDNWRNMVVHGIVHDENAYAMGGVAPHAGLFSTAEDLAKFCQMILNGGIYNGKRLIKSKTIEYFTHRQNIVEGSSRAIGWDTPQTPSSSGFYFSDRSCGHTGFTGTSIWIDKQRDLCVILLTNRVYPTRKNIKISELRPHIHNIIMESIRK